MKKRLITILIATAVMAASAPAVFADEVAQIDTVPQNTSISDSCYSVISPYADIIEYKYRINMKTKKQQYRRWNRTRGYWVDPDWIDIP